MIDFHAHTPAHGPASEGDARAPYRPADFIAFMDEAGIDRAVMLNYQGLLDGSTEANDFVAEFVAHDPRRLIGFGTVNARLPGAVAEVHRMMGDLGLKGMKLHPWVQGISVMEPAMDRVCEALVEHNGILLSHDGTPPYAMATQLASLARRHPDLPIVLGHSGLLDFWREAVVAATETENVYLCVASVNPFAGRMVVERAPRDKVLFGTDAGLAPDGRQNYALARVRELAGWGISDDDIERITVTNPSRLLAGRA